MSRETIARYAVAILIAGIFFMTVFGMVAASDAGLNTLSWSDSVTQLK